MARQTVLKEMIITFAAAFLMAMIWTAIIMRNGLLSPQEVLTTMQSHLRDFGGYFIIFDILVFGLLIRWIHLARKPKPVVSVWE